MFTFDENALKYYLQKLKDYFLSKTVLNTKVDKEEGKGLSTNDFTQEDKKKLGRDFDDVTVETNNGIVTLKFYSNGVMVKKIEFDC